MYAVIAILLLCFQTAFAQQQQGENFDPNMVYLVDRGTNCFIFRGNMPQLNDRFAYVDLTATLSAELAKLNISLPADYQLLDLTLLDANQEGIEIEVEKCWFAQNPSTGSLWHHPIFGSNFDPLYFPCALRNLINQERDLDGLKYLMSELRRLFEQTYLADHLIYFHCNEGKDRTGEVAACYMMQYLCSSYEQAVALGNKIAGKPINQRELNAIRWYAFYLRDLKGMSSIGPIDGS